MKIARLTRHFLLFFCLQVILYSSFAQELTMNTLKKLSLEELMDVKVSLSSRKPEKLAVATSAIQVLTGEEIRRSTATQITDALRLLPNLQVSRLNSYATIVSARGFNTLFSNKLLTMIDGRAVYSPLFAGTYWDVQHVLLEDIDRIETVSGPGGALWGANAVNGVINVVSKNSRETQGLYATGIYGTYLRGWGGIRYGGRLTDNLTYRAYFQRHDRGPYQLPDGSKNTDAWNIMQGGFRTDYEISAKDDLTFQGDFYSGTSKTIPTHSNYDGQNLLALWSHSASENNGTRLQVYFDRTRRRDAPSTFSNEVTTYDVDFQHNLLIGRRQSVVWGLGYRFIRDESETDTMRAAFLPVDRNMPLYSAFFQDEINLITNRLRLILGSKFLHNVYTGFEVQPNARLAFTLSDQHNLWAAVSRAVRTPSRIDRDYHIPGFEVPPGTPTVDGGPDFISEKVIACEAGYRLELFESASIAIAAFYNQYDDLYSVESVPEDPPRYRIMNGVEGTSYGTEISGIYRVHRNWRLRGGYTYFQKKLKTDAEVYDPSGLGYDLEHQVVIQSMLDLPANLQLDVTGRVAGEIADLNIPGHADLDARLAWLAKDFELSVNGRNLVYARRHEYGMIDVPRGIYGQIIWRPDSL